MFFLFDVRAADAGYPGRIARAREQALARVPGALSLVDVTMQETTTWWLVGMTDCITLRGEAIR